MRTLTTLLGTILLGLVPSTARAGDPAVWTADFDTALAQATKENKDLLVDFTGSDWCGWCKRLDKEVFSEAAFLDAARKDFVLVSLDFPRGPDAKARVPKPERNQELLEKHKVSGFPTILLMTPTGEVYGRTGYQPGGARPYVEHLAALRTSGRAELAKAKELLAAWASAAGAAKIEAWERIATALTEMGEESASADLLVPAIRGAIAEDADNAAGRKLRAVELLLKVGRSDAEVWAAAHALDAKNASGLLERAVHAQLRAVDGPDAAGEACLAIVALDALGPIHDKDVALELYANCAYMSYKVALDLPRAKLFAKKAKDLDLAKGNMVEMLDKILAEPDQ